MPDPAAPADRGVRQLLRNDPRVREALLVAAVTGIAAALRLWRIGSVPLGLHGDEAWTGLDAQRILDEGWIGPYVISALGQPAGPLYYVAGLFAFLPETTTTLRAAMAVLGIATIPASYIAFRSMFDRTTALMAVAILAGLMWHLHLSRTGFMVTAQPLMQVLVLWVLFEGLRRRSAWLMLGAGILFGLGVYAYNAYLVFMPVPLIAIALTIARERNREQRIVLGWSAVIFVSAAIIVCLPMIQYVLTDWDTYRLHQEIVSVTSSEEWDDAGVFGKADVLADRSWEWIEAMWLGDRPDFGDGLADQDAPPVHPMIFGLAIVGLAMSAWRRQSTPHAVVIAAVLLLPAGALLTTGDGLFRRTLGITPFIAVLAAMPLAWLWSREPRWAWRSAIVAAVVFPGAIAARQYFGPVQDSVVVRYVYPFELDAAARYMGTLPDGTFIYYYSDRWRMGYETVRFLAPDIEGADRTQQYLESGPPPLSDLDLSNERDKPVAYVFLGAYMPALETAAREHPGGTIAEGKRGEETVFRAYLLEGEE
jgi:4-amino-4-deoxy-L-arabinose transferase-like glycosyltransferase